LHKGSNDRAAISLIAARLRTVTVRAQPGLL
jgi:hypothetical protein